MTFLGVDISADREAAEARAREEVGEREIDRYAALGLTPEQGAVMEECDQRIAAVEAKLAELSEKSPSNRVYGIPADAQASATLNMVLAVMLERGILSPVELTMRRHSAVADFLENVAAHAEALAEADTGMLGPDGEPMQPPPLNRRERRRRR